jgi:hemolysin activation/secretion protein
MRPAPKTVTRFVSCLLMAGAALGAPLSAQTVPGRDELRGVTEAPTPTAPRLDIAGGVERSPCPLADPQYKDVTVTITEARFGNLKGASPQDLEPAWKPFAGSPQPVAALCEIRDAAATILRNKGYLAAVQVPTQRIENGIVQFEVLYARVSAIRARGQTQGAERKLQDYLGHLTEGELFNRFEAERYLLLARDLPGYNVQLTLRPAGDTPGDLIGEVTVLRQPYTVDATVQNYAASATGPWGGQIRASAFGLTGLGDATTLSFYSTSDFEEQQILQAAHEFRPGGEGLRIGGQFTYAWTRPDLGAAAAPNTRLEARTLFAGLSADYPIKRSQGASVWLGAGFDLVNQDVDLIAPLSRDRLRVLWTQMRFDSVDLKSRLPRWRASGDIELRQGIGGTDGCLGATCPAGPAPSRFDGRAGATLLRAKLSGEIALGQAFAIAFEPRAQYAFQPLLAFEEFTTGNYTVGRGYDPGALSGDDGVGLKAELRGPRVPVGTGFSFQPYGFYDSARVWNRGVGGGSDTLYSVGGGARGAISDRLNFDATLAVPLKDAGLLGQKGDVRFLITITARLLPWRTN